MYGGRVKIQVHFNIHNCSVTAMIQINSPQRVDMRCCSVDRGAEFLKTSVARQDRLSWLLCVRVKMSAALLELCFSLFAKAWSVT
jgi:hypothetical protein